MYYLIWICSRAKVVVLLDQKRKKKKKNIASLRAYGAVQACSLQTAEYGVQNPCRPHEAAKKIFKEKQNIYQYHVFFCFFFFSPASHLLI